MRAGSVKIALSLSLMALLVYSTGGNAQQSPRKANRVSVGKNKAEDLLEAEEGSWQVEEEEGGKNNEPMDPLEAHMRARRMVNPNETSINRSYTSRKDAEDLNNEHPYRIMKLKPGTLQAEKPIEEEAPEENAPQKIAEPDFKAPIPGIKPVLAQKEKPEEIPEEIKVASIAQEVPATAPTNAPFPTRKPLAFSPSRGLKTEMSGIPLPPRKEEVAQEVREETHDEAREEIADNAKHEEEQSGDIMHIEGVRIGEHPGKTRIVLDTDGPVEYSYGTKKNTIQIDFDNATWDTQSLKKYPDHSLLNGYKAETSDSYSRMTISLTRPAKILSTKHFSPENGNNNHRIVIDIAPL